MSLLPPPNSNARVGVLFAAAVLLSTFVLIANALISPIYS